MYDEFLTGGAEVSAYFFVESAKLAVTMFGLVLGTVSAGFAWNLEALMLARVVAGAFGGPATSVALSVIADIVPPARRGRALGIVMGAFAAASVLGVYLSFFIDSAPAPTIVLLLSIGFVAAFLRSRAKAAHAEARLAAAGGSGKA